jgi:aspartyl-tRNA(Asn)/glutamyl-tRNA(Gln) amidotransferase subunit C
LALSLEQVRHVAELARLALTPEDEVRLGTQLSAILTAMEALRGVDTEGVEATSHVWAEAAPLREDSPRPSLGAKAAVANAPAKLGTRFAVPKVIE